MPPRIATLLASATEIVYALGFGDCIVGVSHECDYPLQAAEKPRLTSSRIDAAAASDQIDRQVREHLSAGASLYAIDVARLATLAPELIITQAQCDVCAVRYADVVEAVKSEPALRNAQVLALNPQTFRDVLDDVRRVGNAVGCPQRADAYVAELSARMEQVAAVGRSIPPERRPRVACIEWTDPLMLAGNWMPEMVEMAGGTNLLTKAGEHSPSCRWEDLRAADPEVIVVCPCGFDLARTKEELATLEALPGWSELPAVRNHRVYPVDGNAYFNRSGPRMVDSLEMLARCIHPERFGNDMVENC